MASTYLEYLYLINFKVPYIGNNLWKKNIVNYLFRHCLCLFWCLFGKMYFMHCSLIYGVIRVYACHTPNYVKWVCFKNGFVVQLAKHLKEDWFIVLH